MICSTFLYPGVAAELLRRSRARRAAFLAKREARKWANDLRTGALYRIECPVVRWARGDAGPQVVELLRERGLI